MTWPSRLVLVRHAESEGNVRSPDERASYEVPTHMYGLTERGREQARITGQYLHERWPGDFDVIYASYYTRAQETARIMFPGRKIYEDARLAEAQRGIYHAMTREDLNKFWPDEVKRKDREGLYHYRAPGGENWPDVELRIHSFLGTLARDYSDRNLCIVVHGFWLILFQKLIDHFSVDEALDRYKRGTVENASVTIYENGQVNGVGRDRLVFKEHIVPWAGRV